jgi:hypothetical protein
MTASHLVCFTKHYLHDYIKENEMGGALGMHGRDEKCI